MGNNKICAQKGNNLYSKNRIENYKINRLLPNYTMMQCFLTTKKLYHEQQWFVKRFFEMLQIGAFLYGELDGYAKNWRMKQQNRLNRRRQNAKHKNRRSYTKIWPP